MCEYCSNDVDNVDLYYDDYEANVLEIEYNKIRYFQFSGPDFTVDINYCPMCGRRLNDDNCD